MKKKLDIKLYKNFQELTTKLFNQRNINKLMKSKKTKQKKLSHKSIFFNLFTQRHVQKCMPLVYPINIDFYNYMFTEDNNN